MRAEKSIIMSIVILLGLLVSRATAGGHTLVDDYTPETIFSNFTFFTGPDPTEGFVKYVGEAEARDAGLIGILTDYNGESVAYMGVD